MDKIEEIEKNHPGGSHISSFRPVPEDDEDQPDISHSLAISVRSQSVEHQEPNVSAFANGEAEADWEERQEHDMHMQSSDLRSMNN